MIDENIMQFMRRRIYLHTVKDKLKNPKIHIDEFDRLQFVLALNIAVDRNYTMICFKDLVFSVNHSLKLLAENSYTDIKPLFNIHELGK